MFLKISSVSRTNHVDMFTLGVSTARGVDGKIGQFGSGSLMSTLLWLRRFAESPVYMLNGTRVSFESRPERTTEGGVFHRVFQTVKDASGLVDVSSLSVALEHGEIDWIDSAMALREWICNAIDQGTDIVDIVSTVESIPEPGAEPDRVSVYLPMNSEARLYWQSLDSYFLHFTRRENVVAIRKREASPCRLYRKGVYVRTLGIITLYDYNVPIDINECRTGSSDSMTRKLENVLEGFAHNPGREYYDDIFDLICSGADCWEVKNAQCYLYSNWLPTLQGAADRGVRILRDNAKDNERGYRIDSMWYSAMIKLCPALAGYADSFTVENEIELTEAPEALQVLALDCWRFLSRLLPNQAEGKTMPDVFSFVTTNGQMPDNLGHYDSKLNRICIWRDQIASRQTVLEECAHAMSGKADCTRGFQEYLFRLLVESMELIPKRKPRSRKPKAV